MAQDSGGTEPMDQDSGSSEHLSTGDAGSGDTTVMTPVGSASPATEIMMPDDVSVRTTSLTPEMVRLTPEEEQSTLMAVPETYYSHRINLANYDIDGKSDEQIRISVAELLTEVEREVRQAGSVYFRILMKIFVGTDGVVPRYNEAVGWIGKRYTELQKRCTDLSNTERRLLQDLDALRPTVDALEYLRHMQKEVEVVVEKLIEEVKQLRIQKSALAVGVRACVAWEGDRVLGVIAENEEMKKEVKLLRSEFDKLGHRNRGTLLFTGPPVNAPVKKTLVLDLNGLLVKVSKDASNLHPCKAKGYRIETATDKPISFVVRNMAFQFLLRAIWAQEHCEAYHTHREDHKGGVLYAKPLDKLYELNLSTKSVLMVDDSFEKNSTNHLQQAVHPPTFDPFSATRSSDKYLMNTLLPWLEKFAKWPGDTISYVAAHGGEIQASDSWDQLTRYWGVPSAEDVKFLFSSLPRRQHAALHDEYFRKLGELRRQTEVDVGLAFGHVDQRAIAEEGEEMAASTSRHPLMNKPGDSVAVHGTTEVLLVAARDDEMEDMPGQNM
ncbi:hypothetical protein R1sor_013345 [Riccia sorocarpa]|uniref:FCP1 homology domain-containing protein n=1 Tax=Riccia sorocarpa TaxID=122646 RepID=A0ABD3H854_9MARC